MCGTARARPVSVAGVQSGALDNSNACSYTDAPRQQAWAAMPGRGARSSPTVLHQRTSQEQGEEKGKPIGRAAAKPDPCRWPQVPFSPQGSTEGKAMTPSATPMLIDDTGHLEASETVRFGVDGSAYEIDLSARQASELRSMADRYISAARRIQPASRARQQHQPRPRTQIDRQQPRRIRSRATERGLLASPRGRIPQPVADDYEAAMRAAPVPSRSPGTADPEPVSGPAAARATSGRSGTARAARHDAAATESMAATEADERGGGHGLTDREKQELRTIADTAKPERNLVAGRLRTRGLADRDSAGNWWLTDAGRRELMPA
jgi:Lsr2